MDILFENEVHNNIAILNNAWNGDSTFAFLPEKSGISKSWIEKGLDSIPNKMNKEHFVLLTSGSTGLPKMVIGKKSRAERLSILLHELQDSEATEQTVLALPLNYCYAFVNQWLWSRTMNRQLILSGGLKSPLILKKSLVESQNCMICLIGAQIPLFLDNFKGTSFPGVIRVHFAGGPFPGQYLNDVISFFPNAEIFNNYGCAEAMPRLTIRHLDESDDPSNIGKPLPGIEMRTNNNDEILFKSPFGAVGFYDDSGFKEITPTNWIPTGDLGLPIEDGYWRITGRSNEVFKRFGEKIAFPRLLKSIYSEWSGQATFYREKDLYNEEAHILVLTPEPSEKDVKNILTVFRENHPRTHWPVRVESINEFPLLSNGKIDVYGIKKLNGKKIHWKQMR